MFDSTDQHKISDSKVFDDVSVTNDDDDDFRFSI